MTGVVRITGVRGAVSAPLMPHAHSEVAAWEVRYSEWSELQTTIPNSASPLSIVARQGAVSPPLITTAAIASAAELLPTSWDEVYENFALMSEDLLLAAALMAVGVGAGLFLMRYVNRKFKNAYDKGFVKGVEVGEASGYAKGFAEGEVEAEEEVKMRMILESPRPIDALGVLSSFISQEDWKFVERAIAYIGNMWDASKINVDIQFLFADCCGNRPLPSQIYRILHHLKVDPIYMFSRFEKVTENGLWTYAAHLFNYINYDIMPLLAMEFFKHDDAPSGLIYGLATRLDDLEALAAAGVVLRGREERGEEGGYARLLFGHASEVLSVEDYQRFVSLVERVHRLAQSGSLEERGDPEDSVAPEIEMLLSVRPDVTTTPNYFSVLGFRVPSPHLGDAHVRKAYEREIAAVGSLPVEEREGRIQIVTQAYRVLHDPVSRMEHLIELGVVQLGKK